MADAIGRDLSRMRERGASGRRLASARRLASWGAAAALAVACGGSTSAGSPPASDAGGAGAASGAGGTAGAGGGSGAGGTSGASGTGGAGGTSGASGGGAGGSSAAAGASGTGGASGAGGSAPVDCAGRSYCDCRDQPECRVLAEACFCPCGMEPCEPTCACACGGGQYLGCGPADLLDGGTLFGLWLVGWSGGLNHYSWIRFDPDRVAHVNDGAAIWANAPFWPCVGQGEWAFSAQPDSVVVELPGACNGDAGVQRVHFVSFRGKPAFPPGCLLEAEIEIEGAAGPLTACKLPVSACDATLTTCSDPLAP